jgi:hypothetical protein
VEYAEFSCLHHPPREPWHTTFRFNFSKSRRQYTKTLHDNSSTNKSRLSQKPPDREQDFYHRTGWSLLSSCSWKIKIKNQHEVLLRLHSWCCVRLLHQHPPAIW